MQNPPESNSNIDGLIDYSECSDIENEGRLVLCKMIQYIDHLIGNLVILLKETDIWQNTIVVFSSDNGGAVSSGEPYENFPANGFGANIPLRSTKGGVFEGGIRSPAFITGGYLGINTNGSYSKTYNKLMGIEDWYTTFLSAAGIDISQITELNGIDLNSYSHWDNFYQLANSDDENGDDYDTPRDEWVHLFSRTGSTLIASTIVRSDGWKYVIPANNNANHIEFDGTDSTDIRFANASPRAPNMLFNVFDDEYELNNLYDNANYSSIADELASNIEIYFNEQYINMEDEFITSLAAMASALITDTLKPFSPYFDNNTLTGQEILQLLLEYPTTAPSQSPTNPPTFEPTLRPTRRPTAADFGSVCDANGADALYQEWFDVNSNGISIRNVLSSGCPNHAYTPINPNDPVIRNPLFEIPAKPCLADNPVSIQCYTGTLGLAFDGVRWFSYAAGEDCDDAVQVEGDTFDNYGIIIYHHHV